MDSICDASVFKNTEYCSNTKFITITDKFYIKTKVSCQKFMARYTALTASTSHTELVVSL